MSTASTRLPESRQRIVVVIDVRRPLPRRLTTDLRNKSYGVVRDLLDNADDQGGMRSSVIYMAATPEMFDSEKGFAEYDALRSRLASYSQLGSVGLVDWRGVIVDLAKTPLPNDLLVQLVTKIIDLHAIARSWNPHAHLDDGLVQQLVTNVENTSAVVSRPRLLSTYVVALLEAVQQNRDTPTEVFSSNILSGVTTRLSKAPESSQWE